MNMFQERLLMAMKTKGMTQAELARTTGITRASISHYVNGVYEAKQKHIYLMAKALNCSTDYLMGFKDTPNGEPNNNAPAPSEKKCDICTDTDKEGIDLYMRLDEVDKAETRGAMKQMLKADKYSRDDVEFSREIV